MRHSIAGRGDHDRPMVVLKGEGWRSKAMIIIALV